MFCPNCGTQNTDNVTYCTKCGAFLQQSITPHLPQRGFMGAHISVVASLIAFFMFFMPWAALCGMTVSGLDLAMGNMGEVEDGFSSTILFAVPLMALLIAWMAFAIIRNRRSRPSKGAFWRILFSIIGALPLVAAYQLKENIRPYLSWGFYGTVASFFLSAIGGLFDIFDRDDE